SETGKPSRFPAARLRIADSGPAVVLRQLRRLDRAGAGDSSAHTSFLLVGQVFGDGPSVPVARRALLVASRLAVLLPTRAAGVRSLPSALQSLFSVPQSLAQAARSFLRCFLLPHRQTNGFSYEHNHILERRALTLNNYHYFSRQRVSASLARCDANQACLTRVAIERESRGPSIIPSC